MKHSWDLEKALNHHSSPSKLSSYRWLSPELRPPSLEKKFLVKLRILWLLPIFPLLSSAVSIVGGRCALQELSSWQIPGFLLSMWALEALGWVRAVLPRSQWDLMPSRSTL